MWKIIDRKCYDAKNLYNEANYIVRQEFINNGKWIRYNELDKIMQEKDNYYILGSQASQNTLALLDKNWKSFFKSIKNWSKKKGDGYFGKPNLPKYKDKNGRSILIIKNIQCRITNNNLYFSWKPLNKFSGIKTKVNGKLMQIRFVPSGSCYFMEIVYQIEIPEQKCFNNRIAGIDIGVNNFATIANNIGEMPIIINGRVIKSMNQYYNKRKSEILSKSNMHWNNKAQLLTDKHRNKIDTFTHKASKMVIDWCLFNNIYTLIIGRNKGWKDGVNIGHINNQNFVYIPFDKFIRQLSYKCENAGINFIITEEDYTSGTSFIDNELPIEENYNKKRRIKRGLFKSNNGIKINADLNSAYQIIKKVFPNAFGQWNRGCDLHPVRLNV
jgi:putative transposase